MYKPDIQEETKVQKSVFTMKILEEERLRKEKELNDQKVRKESLDRRFKYGQIV